MEKIDQISKKIDQIINYSMNSCFYKSECYNIAKIFKELKDRKDDFPRVGYDFELNALIDELDKLLKAVDRLKNEDWLQENLQVSIKQPILDLRNIICTIINQLRNIGIVLVSIYDISNEYVSEDLKKIFGMPLDSSKSEDQGYQLKRDEINQYLKETEKPQIMSDISLISRTSSTESSNEFADFGNVEMYKLDRTNYTQESAPVSSNKFYSIYKGQMNSTKEPVSIMVLEEYTEDKYRRFVNVLAKANHENLERFIGAVESPLPYVIVTGRSGVQLDEMIKRNYIPRGCKTKIAYQIAKGMAYLHALDIIHRDLCSLNVMVDDEFNARITNFANSRFLPQDTFIMTNNPCSSSDFTAPELYTADVYEMPVDVFAFSGILYELLTGKRPFEGNSSSEITLLLQQRIRPRLTNASDDLKDLICSCWSQEPKKRPSFAAILDIMLTKKISFPDEEDNETVLDFYASKTIVNNDLKNCLKLFNDIYEAICNSFSFSHESFRIGTFIHCYHYLIQEFNLLNRNSLNERIRAELSALSTSLEHLLNTLSHTEISKWFSISLRINALEIHADLDKCMESIYVSMTNLGFIVSKYSYVKSDLVYDLRFCYEAFNDNKRPEYIKRMNEIEAFMKDEGLDLEASQTEVDNRFSNLFTHYKDFYVNRDDFEPASGGDMGSGYSCRVFESEMIFTGQKVAIKEFKTSYLARNDSERYLRREINFLSQLSNKYLVKFVGFNDDPGERFWIITEYIEGGNLEQAIKKRLLSPFNKMKIAFEIAQGMEYLRQKRVLHRDLKPLNVLLQKEGDLYTAKICDFGFARVDTSTVLTRGIGTAYYTAPEVIESHYYSFEADVYSFGSLLYELYCGNPPFHSAKNIEDIYNCICDGVQLEYKLPLSEDLKSLIEDTRRILPEHRPSFTQIIYRMIENKITFLGVKQSDAFNFYEEKLEERK